MRLSKIGKNRVKFFTLGCKVNQYETQAIRENFLHAGAKEINDAAKADIYVINTCTVTHLADRQARQFIRRALKENPRAEIIVTGCYVEKDAAVISGISERIQIIPNSQKHRISDLLNSSSFELRASSYTPFTPLSISEFKDHTRAFVKIQDGCNNFCSYCKVPLVRGKSCSRNHLDILTEAKRLLENNFKEIVLCGICLGDYNFGGYDLADLILDLEKINKNFRIRLSSIEPNYFNHKLISVISNSRKVCPHLHIPLQSGDDKILSKMNRRYTSGDYLNLAAKFKKDIKNFALTTDVLVGFPGETEGYFQNTAAVLKKLIPLRTHIFRFSKREGTPAFKFKDNADSAVIKKKMRRLHELALELSYQYRKKFIGKILNVLIEGNDKNDAALSGYTENYIRTFIKGKISDFKNQIIPTKITEVKLDYTNGIRTI